MKRRTLSERMFVIETELRYIKKMIYGIAVLIAAGYGVNITTLI